MQARLRGGSAARNGLHEQTFLNRQIESLGQTSTNRVATDAEERLMNAAVGDEIVRDPLRGVDGNGEADASGCSSGRVDSGVDADDFAARIDERAAGISAIDGGVGLNGLNDESSLTGLHGAAEGADDAGGERALETEGIANS